MTLGNSTKIRFDLLLVIVVAALLTGPVYSQDTEKAKENFNLGLEEQKNGNTETAIKFYEAAISNDANFADAYLNLGSIYFEQNLLDKAAENFKKVTEIAPDNALGLTNYGKVLYLQKKDQEALAAFQSALKADKDNIEAEKELGKLYYLRLKNYDESIKSLEKFLQADSTDSYAYYLAAMAYKKKKNNNKAVGYFNKAIDLDAGSFESHYNLANIYLGQQRYSQAINHFEKALDLKSKHYLSAYNLAIAIESNDPEAYDKNIAAWEKFLTIARKNPKASKYVESTEKHILELKDAKLLGEE